MRGCKWYVDVVSNSGIEVDTNRYIDGWMATKNNIQEWKMDTKQVKVK